MEGTLAEIRMFAGNFEPMSWAFCNGQLLSIAQNTALFSLIGTTYGGDGQVTFALPDLRGRIPVGDGTGPGLSPVTLGEVAGSTVNSLLVNQLPMHNHIINANTSTTGTNLAVTPTNNFLAQNQIASGNYATTADTLMSHQMLITAGGGQPVNNMMPFLGMNYIICLEGIYPSRN